MKKTSPTETISRTTKTNQLIILTAIAVGLYWIALFLYVPTLPVYVQTKTTHLTLVGAVLAQYGLWQAIIRLPLGLFSDWLGKRKAFINLGFLFAGLGALIMGSNTGIHGLFIGRAFTGLAAGSWVIMVVVFSNLFPPDQAIRATAILSLVNSICRMIATALTGTLNDLGGYSLAFWVASVVAGLAFLVYIPTIEERFPSRKPTFSTISRLFSRTDVLIPSLLNTVVQYAVWATTFSFLPILAKQVGASDIVQSLLVSMNIGLFMIGNLYTTTLAHRMGTRNLVLATFLLIFLGILIVAVTPTLFWIFIAQFLIGLGSGIGYPVLMGTSIEKVDRSERSTAMGLHQALYAIGMFAGPWLSGILADFLGISTMFYINAFLILILGLWGTYQLH